MRQLDFVCFVMVRGLWGLTCDFSGIFRMGEGKNGFLHSPFDSAHGSAGMTVGM
ncbi:hypothetical protein HDF09_003507 [Edaphobacter lichenicola]|uniref:Uncharacterized protein n=1 Tax=Tunturiibacter empetritectus TaxID=3069691 RepID=A0A7W8MSL1_9BACT|nr:hypothetical protein [Edaphobacter lichenicola]